METLRKEGKNMDFSFYINDDLRVVIIPSKVVKKNVHLVAQKRMTPPIYMKGTDWADNLSTQGRENQSVGWTYVWRKGHKHAYVVCNVLDKVTCEVHTGVSHCRDEDEYDISVAKAVSYARAMGLPVHPDYQNKAEKEAVWKTVKEFYCDLP